MPTQDRLKKMYCVTSRDDEILELLIGGGTDRAH